MYLASPDVDASITFRGGKYDIELSSSGSTSVKASKAYDLNKTALPYRN